MAGRRRRLVRVLSSALGPRPQLDVERMVELALALSARPSPAGGEAPLAHRTAQWMRAQGALDVTVQDLGGGRANLLIGPPSGPDLAFYGHLDTSLSGHPAIDAALTGCLDPPPPPWGADGRLWGPGMAVAKAPVAAALVSLLALQARYRGRVGALMAAGGTHRAPPPPPARPDGAAGALESVMGVPTMALGVRQALASGFRPGSVLSVKGGAPGPLYEEPGSLYLAVTVTGPFGAAAFVGEPDGELGGAPAGLPAVIGAIGRWRRRHLAAGRVRVGQLAAAVALGAVEAGLAAKPDLLPSTARLYLYVVTLPAGLDARGGPVPAQRPSDVVASLSGFLAGQGIAATVELYGGLPGGTTDPAHPLFQAVLRAWAAEGGTAAPVRDWRGSTDGGLLRAEGIPTVRVGPPNLRHPDDPRIEGVVIEDLARAARVWTGAAVEFLELSPPLPKPG